ncbi:hypothetical protein ElyMa_000636800 [Elysia marginata]|uniref:Uncharacterized protein n=1 Tax=Elysia marginata TaxID=1093978 RepID=A0AAV4GBK4_9GAST|nr:hypothetical protein ElyMa_000636800 [Elysia marginata]
MAATDGASPTYVSKVTVVPLRSKVREVVDTPETPLPDYEDDTPGTSSSNSGQSASQRNSFKFVTNFHNIISNIRRIGILAVHVGSLYSPRSVLYNRLDSVLLTLYT